MYLTRHVEHHFPSKQVICEACGKVIHSLDALKHHWKRVHAKVSEQCGYCGKWYSSRATMQRHVLNMHVRAEEDHRCEICGFVSSSRTAKKRHIQFKHNPEKRHACSMCEKAFKTPTMLKEHVATHTGVDLYKCSYCDATFKSKSNRSNHYKRHHPAEYNENLRRRPRPTAINNYVPKNEIQE